MEYYKGVEGSVVGIRPDYAAIHCQREVCMSDVPEPSGEEVRRQLQKYVSSLKSAGVAWLPILADEGIAAELANVPPPAENAAAEKPAASLFAAAAEEPPAVPADERRKELILLAQRGRVH